MSYADAEVRPLLDLEGLKQWVPGRVSGYAQLAAAVDRFGTIDAFVSSVAGAMHVDLGTLGFAEGGYLLVKRAAAQAAPGEVDQRHRHSRRISKCDLRAWCRAEGHRFDWQSRAGHDSRRRRSSSTAAPRPSGGRVPSASPAKASPRRATRSPSIRRARGDWPRAARRSKPARRSSTSISSTRSTCGRTTPRASISRRSPRNGIPRRAIPWNAPFELADDLEDAVVQVMTYLIENETAALIMPSRFIAQLHPHFREVMQVLAVQAADEARHIEVFTRRARLKRSQLGLSTIGGQASLKTLVDEPEFAIASFLLSVLGEGTFLSLLWFIERYAPDPVTASVARLAAQDEARHVAFGLAHLGQHLSREPEFPPAARGRGTPASRRAAPHGRPQRRGVRRAAADGGRLMGARGTAAGISAAAATDSRHGRGTPKAPDASGISRDRSRGAVRASHAQLHVTQRVPVLRSTQSLLDSARGRVGHSKAQNFTADVRSAQHENVSACSRTELERGKESSEPHATSPSLSI